MSLDEILVMHEYGAANFRLGRIMAVVTEAGGSRLRCVCWVWGADIRGEQEVHGVGEHGVPRIWGEHIVAKIGIHTELQGKGKSRKNL